MGRIPKAFVICAQRGGGPRLFYKGRKFSNVGAPTRFKSFAAARAAASWLRAQFPLLRDYTVRVIGLDHYSRAVAIWKVNPIGLLSLIQGASGAKNVSDALTSRKKNPSKRQKIATAARLLRDFSGHTPGELLTVKEAPIKTGLVIGTLDGVPYTTIRDGKTEHYLHEFSENSRPLLIASSDGRRLGIVGGRFQFTEAGIIDKA